jgi:hypothetical protein
MRLVRYRSFYYTHFLFVGNIYVIVITFRITYDLCFGFPSSLVLSTSCLASINLTVHDTVIAARITLRWM